MSHSIFTEPVQQSKRLLKAILYAGIITATLDILAAILFFILDTGKNPVIVLDYIASGVFGKAALSGGAFMAVWGLLFHYIIAFSFTIFFFIIYPKIKLLQQNKWITAILYGVFVWLVMNMIVLPLSNTPPSTFNLLKAVRAVIILIACIGLPLTIIAGKYYSVKQ